MMSLLARMVGYGIVLALVAARGGLAVTHYPDSGGTASGGTVNIGLGYSKGLPGTEVEVPVVMVNHTDEGVVYCRFKVVFQGAKVARFLELGHTADHWEIEWDTSTWSPDAGLRPEYGGEAVTKLTVQARARAVEHTYGRLTLATLRFRIRDKATEGQSVELALMETRVRSSRDSPLASTMSNGGIDVGTPEEELTPLGVLACAASPDQECGLDADVNDDGAITVEDAVETILRRDALAVCIDAVSEGVQVLIEGPSTFGGTYAAYRLRVVGASGLLGLRVQLAHGEGCRIVSETPMLRGGYILGVDEPEEHTYTVVMASSDPVVADDTVDVLGIKVAETKLTGARCFEIEDWEAYGIVECHVGAGGAHRGATRGELRVAGRSGRALSMSRVNAVGREGIAVRSDRRGPTEVSVYDVSGRAVIPRRVWRGPFTAMVGGKGLPAGAYVLIIRDAKGTRHYPVCFGDR